MTDDGFPECQTQLGNCVGPIIAGQQCMLFSKGILVTGMHSLQTLAHVVSHLEALETLLNTASDGDLCAAYEAAIG